jgi:hypothetical protein
VKARRYLMGLFFLLATVANADASIISVTEGQWGNAAYFAVMGLLCSLYLCGAVEVIRRPRVRVL